MVYSLGLLVALLYDKLAMVVPVQIDGFAPSVMDGGAEAFKVTVIAIEVLEQPVVLLVNTIVAL